MSVIVLAMYLAYFIVCFSVYVIIVLLAKGYGHDPRVVSNIVDGINCTCDDMHMWLAPFSKGKYIIRSLPLCFTIFVG